MYAHAGWAKSKKLGREVGRRGLSSTAPNSQCLLPLCSCIVVVSESSNCLVANAVAPPTVDYDQDEKRFYGKIPL